LLLDLKQIILITDSFYDTEQNVREITVHPMALFAAFFTLR
jgi:hypothetical protein